MREFDRIAVITIQGGGVYGLSLLGQLKAALEEIKVVPFAFAGASAGAILATLYWCGHQPDDITKDLHLIAKEGNFDELLGPLDPNEKKFDLSSLEEIQKDFIHMMNFLVGKREGRITRELPKLIYKGFKTYNKLKSHAPHRGFFTGVGIEETIDSLIRRSPLLSDYVDMLPKDRMLRFGDIEDLSNQEDIFFAPLFLAVTNLNTLNVDLISSFEQEFSDVPIARAVRASAGYPVFFRPTELELGGKLAWCIDGGVISNFPAWAFSYEFRRKMERSEKYRLLAFRPWLHIGLRLSEDIKEDHASLRNFDVFGKSLLNLLTGAARNRLEDIISSSLARTVTFSQPLEETFGPNSVLDLSAINQERIDKMITIGGNFVRENLSRSTIKFELPSSDEGSSIPTILRNLVEKARLIMCRDMTSESCAFRANVFLPFGGSMQLMYSANMEGDPDQSMIFEDQTQGLTGFAFATRRPFICNLKALMDAISEQVVDNDIFGMPSELHNRVKKDRTWLISTPIFDPKDLYHRARYEYSKPAYEGMHHTQLGFTFDGPRFWHIKSRF